MWSRKGSPDDTWTRPRPPSTTFAVSCVSLLLRFTWACLLKAHLHRVSVSSKTFELRQPNGRVAKSLHILAPQAQHACPFQECVHPKRRGEAFRTGRGKGVIGSGRVVAERNGRV